MITFFFIPNRTTPGGLQSLIINIGKSLTSRNIKIRIIDGKDSYIYIKAIENNILFEFLDIDDESTKYKLDENDVLIITGGFNKRLNYFVNTNFKVVFWSVFPTALIDSFASNFRLNKPFLFANTAFVKYNVKKLAMLLSENNALWFMERSHVDVLKIYNSNIKDLQYEILQIPIEIKSKIQRNIISNSVYNIAYIGRAIKWKILPFIHLIEDIIRIKMNNNIIIHLFSDDCKSFFDYLDQYNIKVPNNIKIIEYNNYSSDEIKNVLSSNVDILFAMGTSLLEGASIGIPTIILDPAYEPLPKDYKYRWLHEENANSLGLPTWIIPNVNGFPLYGVFDMVYNKNKFNFLSEKAYEYVIANHSIELISDRLIQLSTITNLKFKDLLWMKRIFYFKYLTRKILDKILFK